MISQRRSRRSGGAGATRQLEVRAVRGDEGGPCAGVEFTLPLVAEPQQLEAVRVELGAETLDERERPGREDLGVDRRQHLDACGSRQAASGSNCSLSVEPRSARVEDSPPPTISAIRSK